VKRRQFVVKSGLGAASIAIGTGFSSGIGINKKLGVALVGLGQYSTYLLAPALQQTRYCKLSGIVTGTPSKIPVWQRKYQIPNRCVYSYDNMHEIANNDAIDVIYVVVPTGLHAKYTIIAAETGKHVFCEKPMAMNVRECEDMIQACRKNRVKLSIGYRMQHEPNTRTIMTMGQKKPFGQIKSVHAEACYMGGVGNGWRFQDKMGGGALYDMGVYCINGIRYATEEEPIRVEKAKQSTRRPEYFHEVDETTTFTLSFQSGIEATAKTSVGSSGNILRVNCENGWYELEPMQAYSGVKGRTSDGQELNEYISNQQAKQMDDDALAIMENRSMLVPGEEGLRDINLVQHIRACAKNGKPVNL
jgi:glucose-fructose oxidoreductase